jgi:oxepin-CoA hydrolase/3-oxo-5,6-dehydrosuberyl-CoA semialdehyde dehydrogenase
MITLKSYLCGEWRAGDGAPTALVNPSTGDAIAECCTEGLDLGRAAAYAREVGGPELRSMTFRERGELLDRMSKCLQLGRDALIEASIVNAGTTRSDGKLDVDGATSTLAYYAELGKTLGDRTFLVEGPGEPLTRSSRFWGYHAALPLRGVAVHVNAFNFPAWGLAEKAAVAVLAGVPVISKPATATSLLAYRMMERLVDGDILPAGVLQLVCGRPGALLSHLGAQDALSFTGSGATAVVLRRLDNVVHKSVRVNVEADSLNAAVLGRDVEAGGETYFMFIRDAVKEMTQKTGQKCTATRRIFVPHAMIDVVQADLVERLREITVGNPALEEVRMGPLATAQQLTDYRAGVARLIAAGARVVHGSATEVDVHGAEATEGFFVGPLLLRADAPHDAADVHEHEVFGPCATLMPYSSGPDAAALVARGEGALVTGVYSDDKDELGELILGLAPFSGRVLAGSRKVADQATSPGLVLPSCVHGGPGRAGGGEELGGERGLRFYMQRTAIQGDRAVLDRVLSVATS